MSPIVRSACLAAAFVGGIAFVAPSHSGAVVTKNFVDGFKIDLPITLKMASDEALAEINKQRNAEGDPVKILLIASKMDGDRQTASISVRDDPRWDIAFKSGDPTSEQLRAMQELSLIGVRQKEEHSGAKLIELLDPVISTLGSDTKTILLRHRRQDQDKEIIATVGQLVVMRPKGSFQVIYSFDENSTGDVMKGVIESIRR